MSYRSAGALAALAVMLGTECLAAAPVPDALVTSDAPKASDAPATPANSADSPRAEQGPTPQASSAATDDSSESQGLEEVTVTGSRLTAGFATPTPVTVLSSDQLALVAPNNIAAALAQVPSLSNSQLTTNAGTASAAIAGSQGTNGQSLLNLRGLGVNRTLVLMDGQRLGPTNVSDSVDVNLIPQNLVKRVDVVTGGASATYGSDAVAGAVNFVLDTRYQGLKADLSGGITTYGDAPNGNLSIGFGKAINDQVRVIGSLNLFAQGGIGLPPTGRSWDDNAFGAYPNPVAGALPATLVVPNVRASNGTYGGLITGVQGCTSASCQALIGQQFGAAGALEPYQQGSQPGSSFTSGGQGAYVVNGISPSENRQNAFVHAEWDVNSNLTLFSEGLFNRTYTSLQGQTPYETGPYQLTIFRNNAYLPASLATVFAANPSMTSFTMGRFSPDLGDVYVDTLEEVGRFSVGAKGTINDRWTFDSSLGSQYTINNLDMNDTINRNVYAAANAVVDPATGQIVCGSTLQGYDPGCVPANFFGRNSISSAAANYIEGENRGDTVFKETAFEANLRGDLGDTLTLGAGPISVAVGMAYHHDSADRKVDSLSDIYTSCTGVPGCPTTYNGRYGGYEFYNPSPLHGWVSATEGYAELGIPLLKGLPFVKSLNADLAGRMTDYSISGAQDSWKLGLQWALDDNLLVRATSSQDIRAPDTLELFNTATTQVAQDLFPYSGAASQSRVTGLNISEGNPNLQPEIAHTSTAGIVLSPVWFPGFQSSIDYYRITIAHAIESLSAQGVVDGCYHGNQTDCALMTVNGTPVTSTTGITAATTGLVVNVPTENVGNESTSGVDLESAYTVRVGPGNFTARILGNYLLTENRATAATGCPVTSVVGSIGGCLGAVGYPRWTGNLSLKYDTERFGVYVQERLIDGGRADAWDELGVTINRNQVPTVTYTDLTLSYSLNELLGGDGSVYLNVTNLFNRNPPVTVTRATSWEDPTAYNVYDVLGRRFLLGVRLKL
jgi:iron complex outermembrane receptor protein